MTEREFYLPSSDGNCMLRCMEWIPGGEVKAVLQISHGMVEHIGRYREFGFWMADHGIAVYGHDHLGHGRTAGSKEDYGYFGTRGGTTCLIKDIRRLTIYGKKKYPGVRHFLLGHSMGSFAVRKTLTVYSDGTDGVILLGTGAPPEPAVGIGWLLAFGIGRIKGERYRSRLLFELSLGAYNRKFKPIKTAYDWLTRDEENARSFSEDPLCQFTFTAGAYRDFFQLILSGAERERAGKLRTDLPVLILSGDRDPVGGNMKGVRKVYERYDAAGVEDLSIGSYVNARHEILNEINREEVYGDLLEWIERHLD